MPYDYFNRLLGQQVEDEGGLGVPGTGAGTPPLSAAPAQRQGPPSLGLVDPNQMGGASISPAPGYTIGATNAGSGSRHVAGSTFVNFGDLYRANAAKSQAMARRLTGKAEQQGNQARNDIGSAEGSADAAIAAGTNTYQANSLALPAGQAAGTRSTTSGGGLQSESTKGQQAAAPAPAPPGALTPAEMAARANRGYGGPASLADQMGSDAYANLGTEAQRAQDYATGLNTAEGVQTALGYHGSTGLSREDAALAQGAGGGAFGTLAKRYGGLMQSLQDAQDRSKARADEAAAESSDAQKLYQADLDRYSQQSNTQPQGSALPGITLNTQSAGTHEVDTGDHSGLGSGSTVSLKDIQGDIDKYEPSIAQGASQYGVDEATVRSTLQGMTPEEYARWEADPAGFWKSIAAKKGGGS